jgi:cytochrome b561
MSSPLAALKAVLAGFFGVRSRKNAEQVPIKLLHLIVIALLCALLLVGILLSLARYLVMHGGG